MPPDDLDQLGPGAALDAIVAREVMGLDVLGDLPTANDPALPWPVPAGSFDAVVRPVYVLPGSVEPTDADPEMDRHIHGLLSFHGRHPSNLRAVPRYSTDVAACATVIQACRDAGWGDTAWTWDEIRQFGRSFVELNGECRTTGQRGPHEYAVACVAAVRVARLVGGPLVKREQRV